MVATLASSSRTQIAEILCAGASGLGGMHGKASSQTDAKYGPTLSPPKQILVVSLGKMRPDSGFCFEAARITLLIERDQKSAAVFSKRLFFASVCSIVRGMGLWRRSNFWQSKEAPGPDRVLIKVDDISVQLVREEGRGHVSQTAYRLFASGVPMGRRASLAAC